MPLITCPDCAQSISSKASSCVHCGRPSEAEQPYDGQAPCKKCGGRLQPGATTVVRSTAGDVLFSIGAFFAVAGIAIYALYSLGIFGGSGLGSVAGAATTWPTAVIGLLMMIVGVLLSRKMQIYRCPKKSCAGGYRLVPLD